MSGALSFGRPLVRPALRGAILGESALAALAAAERCIPAVAGLALVRAPAVAVAVGLTGSALMAVRGMVARRVAMRVRCDFVQSIARRAESLSAMSALGRDPDRAGAMLFVCIDVAALLATDLLPSLVGSVLATFVIVPVLLWYAPHPLLLAGAAAVVLAFGLSAWLRRSATRAMDKAQALIRPLASQASVLLHGHAELVGSGAVRHQGNLLLERARSWSDANRSAESWIAATGRAPSAVALGVVIAAGWFWLDPAWARWLEAVSSLLVIASAGAIALGAGRSVVQMSRGFKQIDELDAALAGPSDPVGPSPGADPSPADAELRFEDVRFSYAGSAVWAVRVSAECPARTSFAIVGPNGSGKSTLARLLLRMADPEQGALIVEGVNMRDIDVAKWRARIGYLSQQPFLPDQSNVQDAIRMLAPDATTERMRAELNRVGLLAVLERKAAQGWPHVSVQSLSSGERQRLSIARVLCRKAELFLLDEPEANLDESGMRMLVELVKDLKQRSRVIAIAHDPRVIAAFDRVIELGVTTDPTGGEHAPPG